MALQEYTGKVNPLPKTGMKPYTGKVNPLPEKQEAPTEAFHMPDFGSEIGEGLVFDQFGFMKNQALLAKTAAQLFITSDDKERAEIIKSNFPEIEIEEIDGQIVIDATAIGGTRGIDKKITPKEFAGMIGSTATAAMFPPAAVPAAISKAGVLPGLARFGAQAIPRSAAAGAGGGTAVATEQLAEGVTPQKALEEGFDSAKEFGLAEFTGLGAGKVIEKLAPLGAKATGGFKDAIEFAREKGLPITLSPKNKALEKMSVFGDFVIKNKASQVSEFINQEIKVAEETFKSAPQAAHDVQVALTTILKESTAAKNTSFDYLNTVGKKTQVDVSAVLNQVKAAKKYLEESATSVTSEKLMEQLNQFLTNPTNIGFGSLDAFRKVFNKKNIPVDVRQIMNDGFASTYKSIGEKLNFDVWDAVQKANKSNKDFIEFAKTGGLKFLARKIQKPEQYVFLAFKESNLPAMKILQQNKPELVKALFEQRMAQLIKESTKKEPSGITRLDGAALTKALENNSNVFSELFKDSKQLIVLKRFANYAKHVDDLLKKSTESEIAGLIKTGAKLTSFGGVGGGAALTGGGVGPAIVYGGAELGAGGLAGALTNPNGLLFKMFSELDPAKLNAMVTTLTRSVAADE